MKMSRLPKMDGFGTVDRLVILKYITRAHNSARSPQQKRSAG
jgi:hypothetical protein